jgi:C4-dicarboxylate transporter DctQ subunit
MNSRDPSTPGLPGRLAGAVDRAEELALAWGILAIAGLSVANVGARVLTGHSILFAQELAGFLIVGVTFLGIGYAAGRGRHIRMTALYDALGPRARKVSMLVITATTSLGMGWLAWLGFVYALGTVAVLGPVSPVLRVPLFLVYLMAPVGFALGALQYALAFWRNAIHPDVWLSWSVRDEYDEPAAPDM